MKRPPPPQQSFFSLARLSKLLPNQQTPAAQDEASTLKRAHFILPEMTVVYPISAANPPSTPSMKEEKKSIEEREMERRRRILRGGTSISSTDGDECWWSLDQVESFYRECCVGREEVPDPGVSLAFKVSLPPSNRCIAPDTPHAHICCAILVTAYHWETLDTSIDYRLPCLGCRVAVPLYERLW